MRFIERVAIVIEPEYWLEGAILRIRVEAGSPEEWITTSYPFMPDITESQLDYALKKGCQEIKRYMAWLKEKANEG